MKPLHFILLSCLLAGTAALYLFSPSNEFPDLASSSIFVTSRRSLRGLRMSRPDHENRHPEAKVVVDEAFESSGNGSIALKDSRTHGNSNSMEELVYYIDYHGVTTHPNPTPKHPKP